MSYHFRGDLNFKGGVPHFCQYWAFECLQRSAACHKPLQAHQRHVSLHRVNCHLTISPINDVVNLEFQIQNQI